MAFQEVIDAKQRIIQEFVPGKQVTIAHVCLLYTSPSPRDRSLSRMPSSA